MFGTGSGAGQAVGVGSGLDPERSFAPQPELDSALPKALTVLAEPDPATAVSQVRVRLAALALVQERTDTRADRLRGAGANMASLDAYAARDVLRP